MGKKQMCKQAMALSLAAAMAAGSATTAFAGQWKQDATGYWWDENGNYPKNEWKWLDGNGDGISESYYFGADGYLNRNSNARIYRIRWRFCYLYVSYSSIFIPIQHFSRLI